MNLRSIWAIAVWSALVLSSAGCASRQGASGPPTPARISHIVLVSLNDPVDADALIADSDRRLATIPSVVSYAAGRHIDTGRANVAADYDVGLYIGFDSVEGYSQYVDHPDHVNFVSDWMPRIRSLVIRDVLDEVPAPPGSQEGS
jgi:hypothetical protein